MAIQDYALILNVVMWVQFVLATIFIALRIYTRYFLLRCIGWDDIMIVIALITFLGYVACVCIGVSYGVGKKFAAVPRANYPKAVMWEAIGQGICIMGIAASKSSVALFLLRIVLNAWHKAILWFCIISTTILCIITTTLLYAQCRPTAFLWNHTIPGGYCWLDFTKVGLTMGAWSATMDFILAILPWFVIWGLNMRRKEKFTVCFALSLGIFAGICSVVRTVELQALSSVKEYVYDTVSMLLWSSTEVLVSILCACIPLLRPLYVQVKYGSRAVGSSYHSEPFSRSGKKSRSSSNCRISRIGVKIGTDIEMDIPVEGNVSAEPAGTKTHVDGVKVSAQNGRSTSEESILREQQEAELAWPIQHFEEDEGWIRTTDEIRVVTSSD